MFCKCGYPVDLRTIKEWVDDVKKSLYTYDKIEIKFISNWSKILNILNQGVFHIHSFEVKWCHVVNLVYDPIYYKLEIGISQEIKGLNIHTLIIETPSFQPYIEKVTIKTEPAIDVMDLPISLVNLFCDIVIDTGIYQTEEIKYY